MFREWQRLALPGASYAIQPRVWSRAGLARAAHFDAQARVLLKNRELCMTAIAWTEAALYLVDVRAAFTVGDLGNLLFRANLFRADPDYAAHRGKRTHLVALTRDASQAIVTFARLRRVHVIRFPLNEPLVQVFTRYAQQRKH